MAGDNDKASEEAEPAAHEVPMVRREPLDGPEPDDRGRDIDATVRGIGPSGADIGMSGQQPRECQERDDPRREPQSRPFPACPCIKRETSRDLTKGRHEEEDSSFEQPNRHAFKIIAGVCGSQYRAPSYPVIEALTKALTLIKNDPRLPDVFLIANDQAEKNELPPTKWGMPPEKQVG